MKRIAMFSLHTSPLASQEGKEVGGMNVYVLELSKQLSQKGIAVDIFTRSHTAKVKKIIQLDSNLRVIHIPAGPHQHIPKKALVQYIPEFVENFCGFMQKEGLVYDLFHCHYYLSGLVALGIRKKIEKKIPLCMNFHTLGLMKNLVARNELEKEETKRIAGEFELVKESDVIIAGSETDKAYLMYLYNCDESKIVIIHPGVNTKFFKPMSKTIAKQFVGADQEHKIILFVGRIEPLKGIDALLYAMKIILTKNPSLKVCLWIIGGDVSQTFRFWSKELQKLENIRELLQIETVVKFVGKRSQDELPYFYNASELVVMPSHYESFGMVALEAMACGVPVITTNVTGIASILDKEHESLVTSVNNPLLLAEQMEHIITSDKVHEKISKDVFQRVQDSDWEHVTAKILQVYETFFKN